MPFVGLVSDPRWEPPDDLPGRDPHRRDWHVPWRTLAWVAVLVGLMLSVSAADRWVGSPAGFGLLMLAVALGVWRLDRWCARQNWRGLRDYQS